MLAEAEMETMVTDTMKVEARMVIATEIVMLTTAEKCLINYAV